MISGYKQTEVGVIPVDWDVKPLSSLGVVIRGASPRPKGDSRFYGGDVPRLMVEDITRDKKFVTPQIDFLTKEGAKRSRPCKSGTLTIVCSGTPGVVGLPSFLAVDACIHDGVMALLNISPKAFPDYLFHQLTRYQEKLYLAATHGGTFVNLTTAGLRTFEIALPPTDAEQRVIAEVLSDVDGLLGGLERLIAKKSDLKQAAMQQLLTGQTRLPGFRGNWETKALGSFVEIRKGELITEANAVSGPIPVIAGGKQPAYFHNRANRFGKTITISGSGASAGYVSFYASPIFASDCSTIGEGKNYSIEFVYLLLQARQEEIYRAQTGGAQPHIHPNDLNPISVTVPKYDEQIAISKVLMDMDVELATLEQRWKKTHALKQAIIQELLTGKTRLV